jgi:hypothetical protein
MSAEHIKEVSNSILPLKKLYSVLNISCKTAVNDLQSARQTFRMQEEARNKAEQKAKEEAEKKRKEGGPVKRAKRPPPIEAGCSALFTMEPSQGRDTFSLPIGSEFSDTWDLSHPFLITGTSWLKDCYNTTQALKTVLDDFPYSFRHSSLRVTEGRAQFHIMDLDC